MPAENDLHYELIIGDIMEVLPQYQDKFHLIIADPPFGLEFNKSSHEYGADDYILYEDKFTGDEYEQFSHAWISRCFDALTPNGSLYVISGWTRIGEILNAVKRTKFTLLNHIIWQFSWGVFTKRKYVTSHYHILFLVKNKKEGLYEISITLKNGMRIQSNEGKKEVIKEKFEKLNKLLDIEEL